MTIKYQHQEVRAQKEIADGRAIVGTLQIIIIIINSVIY